jgi:quinohemoprotein ethanol dehydrogenase
MQPTKLLFAALLAMFAGCNADRQSGQASGATSARVDESRIENALQEPGNWFTTGRNFGEDRFSPLKQIHDGNVGELGFAWEYDLRTQPKFRPIKTVYYDE